MAAGTFQKEKKIPTLLTKWTHCTLETIVFIIFFLATL